jgi:hypothetical protein
MTDLKSLCEELTDALVDLYPLIYNIASNDEDECEMAYYYSALVRKAIESLNDEAG